MIQWLWVILVGATAYSSGRGVIRWAIAAYFIGWLVVIPLLLMPKKSGVVARRLESIKEAAEEHVVKQEFKGVNNVEDLFNQLEKK